MVQGLPLIFSAVIFKFQLSVSGLINLSAGADTILHFVNQEI